MSTDKTLADVQPGGRVRLGDALLPCPFCGNDAEFVPYKNNGLTLKCKSMGCIQRHQRTLRYGIDWLRTSMAEHWNARALSAQPSPGGQGDKRAINKIARGLLADQMVGHAKHVFTVAGDDEIGVTCGEAVRAIETALAARQPVGEPVAYLDLGAGGYMDVGTDLSDDELAALPKGRHMLGIIGTYGVDGYKPAQAVDLPYSLDADPAGIRARVCDVITGTLMVGAQGHTPPPAGHWAEPFWQAARADAAAQALDLGQFRDAVMHAYGVVEPDEYCEKLGELLDLIDSQAVGNG